MDTEFLAISTDKKYTLKKWHEDELSDMVEGGILPYTLVADPTGDIGKSYGVYDYQQGVDIRGRFIIDPDGIIQAQEVLAADVGRNAEEMLRQIKAFQHARESNEVTPSDWQPGQATIKPNLDLVGKVKEQWQATGR